jgi:hypothetical protein
MSACALLTGLQLPQRAKVLKTHQNSNTAGILDTGIHFIAVQLLISDLPVLFLIIWCSLFFPGLGG